MRKAFAIRYAFREIVRFSIVISTRSLGAMSVGAKSIKELVSTFLAYFLAYLLSLSSSATLSGALEIVSAKRGLQYVRVTGKLVVDAIMPTVRTILVFFGAVYAFRYLYDVELSHAYASAALTTVALLVGILAGHEARLGAAALAGSLLALISAVHTYYYATNMLEPYLERSKRVALVLQGRTHVPVEKLRRYVEEARGKDPKFRDRLTLRREIRKLSRVAAISMLGSALGIVLSIAAAYATLYLSNFFFSHSVYVAISRAAEIGQPELFVVFVARIVSLLYVLALRISGVLPSERGVRLCSNSSFCLTRMSGNETLGYVLSPARPPIVQAALLEEAAGEVSVGDIVAIPIALNGENLYILGTVLSISVHRPLLDKSSKAPYALSRGDTMNLIEDVDMLEISELEDVAYVAELFVHTFVFKDKLYPVHVIVPGSKIVRPPSGILAGILSGDVRVGKLRGYDADVYLNKRRIFSENLAILGGDMDFVSSIVEALGAEPALYLGRNCPRPKLAPGERVEAGKRTVDSVGSLIEILEKGVKGTVVVDGFRRYPQLLLGPLSPYISNREIARIFLDSPSFDAFRILPRLAENYIIFGPYARTKEQEIFPRAEALDGLSAGDALIYARFRGYRIPLVVRVRWGRRDSNPGPRD